MNIHEGNGYRRLLCKKYQNLTILLVSFFSVDDWLKNFENKVKPFVELKDKLDETAAKKMGIKDPEAYP